MSYAAATFPDATPFDGRVFSSGVFRKLVDGAIVSLGTVAGAILLAVAATVAAIWVIGIALSGNATLHGKASIGLATIGVPNQRLMVAGTADFSGSIRLAGQAEATHLARTAELARAAIPQPAPIDVVPLPEKRPVAAALNVPPPVSARQPQPQSAAVRAATHVAELTPSAQPAPAPPKPVAHDSRPVPLPPQRPAAAPHIDAKDESAPSPVSPAPPQVALVTPPPPVPKPKDNSPSPPEADHRTAIYDIEAHTVYLPNGERLEAHSGLGHRRDDPRYVGQKNRGPTPPNVYTLALRERLFHGVRAIRLKPADDDKMFGRDGMLAHTYMLGPSGQSFGCVSFKNYKAFLQAYLDGEVDRLVVVPRLDRPPPTREARARAAKHSRYALNSQ